MTRTTAKPHNRPLTASLLLKGEDRLKAWQKVRGLWKNRKPDPIKELEKMRAEWERDPL
jgi:hypothetical protein